MRKQIIILVLSFFLINIYGKNIAIKYTVENITVYISCFSYREEANKGIIIGEYVKKLSEKYKYSDSIEIFLEMTPTEKPKYFFRDKKKYFFTC